MAASGRRGAPRVRGRADMGADVALWIESTAHGGPKRYGLIMVVRLVLTAPECAVAAVVGEERPDGGAMAGDGWGSPVRRSKAQNRE